MQSVRTRARALVAAVLAGLLVSACGPDASSPATHNGGQTASAGAAATASAITGAAVPQAAVSAGPGSAPVGPARIAVQASVSHCGTGWSGGPAGRFQFTVHNTDTRNGEVALADAKTGALFTELEPVGPGTAVDFAVDLTGGTYRFRCAMEDADVIDGPAVTVTGTLRGAPTPSVVPVTQQDLIPATLAYQKYVTGALPQLVAAAEKLRNDVVRGDRAAAERDWLPAHQQYERLGAAYGAFGDADGAINGLPNGLPKGVDDPGFTGFHRVEYGLWHGQSTTEIRPFAAGLVSDLQALEKTFRSSQIDPLQMSIRAHEISENALQFSLTGQDDFGSHSGLATVSANLDGTATVLGILTSLLKPRYPQLGALNTELAKARGDINALFGHGRWQALSQLTRAQKEVVDSDLSQLTEMLAPVAAILEPRRF